jgi:CheY-like chemotaxis protein
MFEKSNMRIEILVRRSKYGYPGYPFNKIKMSNQALHKEQFKSMYNFSGRTVLIVDDVLLNLIMLEIYFKNTGASILFAENGKEALDICTLNQDVDIVLMDIQMPVMNGLDATREIRKINPGIPVIVISTYYKPEDKRLCFDAGCSAFLPKPCHRNDLLYTVNYYFNLPAK